jgi:glutamyl-tRNA synthetase
VVVLADNKLRKVIRKIALLNAVDYGGKARSGSVLGKLLAEQGQLKSRVKEVVSIVEMVVVEVNKLSPEKQRKIVEEEYPEELMEKKLEEERELPPLPSVEKYERVVTRFAPNPDCVLHLGSARAIVLCYEYAKRYDGLFYIRFEDTDPKNKRPKLKFYDSIREDLRWLGCEADGEFIQSDRLPIYYEYAEKLLKEGNAYVCTCKPGSFREKILAEQPCPCRGMPPNEHVDRWKRMLDGTYDEGEAVVRVKTDLNHPNPAVRDWPALRIIDTVKYSHPRVGSKYHVWPLYNFACGIDDHLIGVTHVIRGKEHLTNEVRQKFMYHHLGWAYPEAIHYGRLKITGASLSKSTIVQGIKDGVFKSWDDPRLATLAALRRRGIVPEAIRELIIDVGPKTVDAEISWENLYAHNRKLIDPESNRYFFVCNPVQLTVRSVSHTFTSELLLHPDYPKRGHRQFKVAPTKGKALFWVSSNDSGLLKTGKVIRLMELFNVQVETAEDFSIDAAFHSESYEEAKKMAAPLIHWIPIETGIPCEVVMPDASKAEGIAEYGCKELQVNEIVQFERFGFVRIDKFNKKLTAYFSHR